MKGFLEDLPLVFDNPYWLWLLLVVPVLLLLRGRAGRSSSIKFPSVGLVTGISRKVPRRWGGLPGLLYLAKVWAFILLVLFGGLLVLKWRPALLLHLPALAWGLALGTPALIVAAKASGLADALPRFPQFGYSDEVVWNTALAGLVALHLIGAAALLQPARGPRCV